MFPPDSDGLPSRSPNSSQERGRRYKQSAAVPELQNYETRRLRSNLCSPSRPSYEGDASRPYKSTSPPAAPPDSPSHPIFLILPGEEGRLSVSLPGISVQPGGDGGGGTGSGAGALAGGLRGVVGARERLAGVAGRDLLGPRRTLRPHRRLLLRKHLICPRNKPVLLLLLGWCPGGKAGEYLAGLPINKFVISQSAISLENKGCFYLLCGLSIIEVLVFCMKADNAIE